MPNLDITELTVVGILQNNDLHQGGFLTSDCRCRAPENCAPGNTEHTQSVN